MTTLFDIIETLFLGFIGLLVVLFLLALVFGKRVRKRWEFEAGFRDAAGREFGEFDIELSRIEKVEADYSVKAKFRMRHASLVRHQAIGVYIDDVLVLEGMVESNGRILLGRKHFKNSIDDVRAGQLCRVLSGGDELFSTELVPD